MIHGFLLGVLHSQLGFSELCVCSVSRSPLHDVAVGGKLKRNWAIWVGVLGEDERNGIKSGEAIGVRLTHLLCFLLWLRVLISSLFPSALLSMKILSLQRSNEGLEREPLFKSQELQRSSFRCKRAQLQKVIKQVKKWNIYLWIPNNRIFVMNGPD